MLDHQLTRRLRSPAMAALATAPRPSFTASQRVRVTPWVHARRKVPVSNSLEMSGAPQNMPMTKGTASTRKSIRCATCSVLCVPYAAAMTHAPMHVPATLVRGGTPAPSAEELAQEADGQPVAKDLVAANPELDHFAGRVSDSGEGRWTLEAAIDERKRLLEQFDFTHYCACRLTSSKSKASRRTSCSSTSIRRGRMESRTQRHSGSMTLLPTRTSP